VNLNAKAPELPFFARLCLEMLPAVVVDLGHDRRILAEYLGDALEALRDSDSPALCPQCALDREEPCNWACDARHHLKQMKWEDKQ